MQHRDHRLVFQDLARLRVRLLNAGVRLSVPGRIEVDPSLVGSLVVEVAARVLGRKEHLVVNDPILNAFERIDLVGGLLPLHQHGVQLPIGGRRVRFRVLRPNRRDGRQYKRTQ